MREIKKKSNSWASIENPRSKYGIPWVSNCTRQLQITLEITNFSRRANPRYQGLSGFGPNDQTTKFGIT